MVLTLWGQEAKALLLAANRSCWIEEACDWTKMLERVVLGGIGHRSRGWCEPVGW